MLTISKEGGQITIKFKKRGWSGVKLYSKRADEATFTFLAIDTASPYVDSRDNLVDGKPEKREYYAYYIDHDDQVGEPSDIISINA